jgi:hypothetical protein
VKVKLRTNKKKSMKKIFALALVGLFSVTLVENANAFSTDNDNVEFVIGDYDAPTDAIAFEIVPVTTDFVYNVADESVNYTSVGGLLADAVPIDSGVFVNNVGNTFLDIPIDYGIRSNEFTLNEPIPNLTEYVKTYNETFGYAEPELIRNIATNVGKLTTFDI